MSDTSPQPLAIKIKDLQLEELKITDRLVSSHQEGETLEALTKRFHKQALAVNNPTPQEIEMEVTLDKEVVPLAMVVEAPEEAKVGGGQSSQPSSSSSSSSKKDESQELPKNLCSNHKKHKKKAYHGKDPFVVKWASFIIPKEK